MPPASDAIERGESYLDANGFRFRITLDGARDAPWLIFSNSLATDLTLWNDQVDALKDSWRILRYDYRGHGRSAPTDGSESGLEFGRDTLAADLLAIMDKAGIDRAHHVGTSMGSLAGLAAASLQPERFVSITVCNSRLCSSDASAAHLERRATLALDHGMDALIDITLEKWFARSDPPVTGALRDRIVAMIRHTSSAGFAGYARGTRRYDFTTDIGSLPMPVLLVAGTMDGDVLQEFQTIAGRHPGVRCEPVPGAGHLPNVEAPGRYNALLNEFLTRSGRQS